MRKPNGPNNPNRKAIKLGELAIVAYTFRTTATDYVRFLMALMHSTGLKP